MCSVILFFYLVYDAVTVGRQAERNRWATPRRIECEIESAEGTKATMHYVMISTTAAKRLEITGARTLNETDMVNLMVQTEQVSKLHASALMEIVKIKDAGRRFKGVLADSVQFFSPKPRQDVPSPWQVCFHSPVSAQMEGILDLYADIMAILVFAGVAVGYLLYAAARTWTWDFFNFVPNLDIRRFLMTQRPFIAYTHQTTLEVIWTLVPCILLLIIAIPSFTLSLALDEEISPWLWVKVIGNQWYWVYEYSTMADIDNFDDYQIESFIVPEDEVSDIYLRLLEVDNNVILPFSKPARFLITSNDVLHS